MLVVFCSSTVVRMSHDSTSESHTSDSHTILKCGDTPKQAVTRLGDEFERNVQTPGEDTRCKRKYSFQMVEEFVFGQAEGLRRWCSKHGLIYVIISSYFRGVGQVCFMDNPVRVL